MRRAALSRSISRPLALPIFLPLLILTLFSGCDSNWHVLRSNQWRFSAKFPGQVSEESHATFGEFQAVTKQATFRITSTKVSPLPAKEALAELVAMRDGSADSLHATLAESKNIDVQGEPAIEFTLIFTVEGKESVSHTRYVRCGNRFHQLIVVAGADADIKEEVRKFFDSFRVETE